MSEFDRHVGTVVDAKYQIVRRIGSGGMGAVFLATHLGTERMVAIKLISPRFATDKTFVERFRREARAAGRLRHPNIVDVTDFGFAESDGEPLAYLVMEYLDGCTLAEVLDEDPQLPVDWVVGFFDQLASAVDEAHRQGIVHRDLKPANVWLEPNRRGGYTVKVLDFGLARLADRSVDLPISADNGDTQDSEPSGAITLPIIDGADPSSETIPYGRSEAIAVAPAADARAPAHRTEMAAAITQPAMATRGPNDDQLTRAGTVLGTPHYMSPEQCQGHAVGPASDIYALGVIAYQMLAGRPPFEGDLATLLRSHATVEPEPLDRVAPGVPGRVSAVVMTALAKDPAARPATAGLFAAALRAKAESWRRLFRNATIACADHYPLFLRISFFALLPFLAVQLMEIANVGLEESGAVPHVVTGLATLPLAVLALVTSFLASVVSRGVATLVLAQLLLAPLRRARVRIAVSALRRRAGTIVLGALTGFVVVIGPLIVTLLAVALTVSLGLTAAGHSEDEDMLVGPVTALVLCVVAGVVSVVLLAYALRQLVRYQLFPVVLLVEDRRVREGLRRSRELARRSMRDVAAATVVTFLPLTISSLVSGSVYQMSGLTAGTFSARLVDLALSAPIVLFTDPFISVITGLLYIKLRQAAGEPVEDILNRQFADEEMPERRWQQLLSSGSHSASSPSNGSGRKDRTPS